ncbi:hypothetical protein MBAV_004346, partial [Candidatus Magnetobacterium bavaricum]
HDWREHNGYASYSQERKEPAKADNTPGFNYSYGSVPTLLDFSEDNSFIRAVIGPFGSGKSSACVITLSVAFCFFAAINVYSVT